MSLKSAAEPAPGFAISLLSVRGVLRIAVPSWRSVGGHVQQGDRSGGFSVSKEELQQLFRGELKPVAVKCSLTEQEERELSRVSQLRDALYPRSVSRSL